MFLLFLLSSARWPHLYSISQGTSGFGCFMTQCSSLKMQCCDLKHRVRTVMYNYLWPKCCCFCSPRHHSCRGTCSCSCAACREALAAEPPPMFLSPWAHVSFVHRHFSLGSATPTWLYPSLPSRISWAPGYALRACPVLLLRSVFWVRLAGGRCAILFTLRRFLQVTGRILLLQNQLQSKLFSLILA